MKQGISPTVAIVVILVVIVVVVAVGYFVFMKPKGDEQLPPPEDMQADMEKMGKFGAQPQGGGAGSPLQGDIDKAAKAMAPPR